MMAIARFCELLGNMVVGIMMVLIGVLSPALGQNSDRQLPVVTAASMPLYPRTALLVHIEGTVKIRVTTDGKNVSALDAESGPAMLVQAAEDNIRTWQFEKHKPATFPVTFQYHFEEPGQCSVGNSTVVLHLPSDIEIAAQRIHTCDPASGGKEDQRK